MTLIGSERHTPADRLIWADAADADIVHARSLFFHERIRRARDVLSSFARTGCYAGVSWGKDSVVVAHLLRKVAPSVPLVHLRPTNHNPDCDDVRDTYFRDFPGQPYHEIDVDYSDIDRNLSDEEVDALTDAKWYAAFRSAKKRFGLRHISGIRAAESGGRKVRMKIWGESSPNACAPIGWWSTQDVFSYLAAHDLPVHPAYACLGGGRWEREKIRVSEIGDTGGIGMGRRQWEQEYYGAELRRVQSSKRTKTNETTRPE